MEQAKPYMPRLVVLKNDGNGYGFNLECERGKFGQFVRNIRPGSPADRGGLLPHDRVVEVNGKNVEEDTHQQTVIRIKELENVVTLLVVDQETDSYYLRRNVRITVDLLNARVPDDLESEQQAIGQNAPPNLMGAEKSADGSLNEFADAHINNLNAASSSHQSVPANGHANVSQSVMQGPVGEVAARPMSDAPSAQDEMENSAQGASINDVRARLNAKRGEKIAAKQNQMSFQQKSAVFDSL